MRAGERGGEGVGAVDPVKRGRKRSKRRKEWHRNKRDGGMAGCKEGRLQEVVLGVQEYVPHYSQLTLRRP